MGKWWTIFCFIASFIIRCVGSFLNVWDCVGDAKNGCLPPVWMVELVGETFLRPPPKKKKKKNLFY